jgi:hypothetical protein
MDSTPPPIPISMTPLLIFDAIIAQDSSPDEQSLLIATIGVVSGKSARNIAILFVIYPAPGWRLFPIAMSWTSFGSILALSAAALKTQDNINYGAVSLKCPFFALVMAVRTAEQMTTSSGFFVVMSVDCSWQLILSSRFISSGYDKLYKCKVTI